MQPVPKSMRLVQAASALLLALNVGLTALLFDRLPETIATKWSVTGMANSAGHRDLAWLGPMSILEYWIPAEELPELNRNIVGLIAVVSEFR